MNKIETNVNLDIFYTIFRKIFGRLEISLYLCQQTIY